VLTELSVKVPFPKKRSELAFCYLVYLFDIYKVRQFLRSNIGNEVKIPMALQGDNWFKVGAKLNKFK